MDTGYDADVVAAGPPAERPAEAVFPPPRVSNANRIIVGFPLSTITISDAGGAAAVADLVARLCRALGEPGSHEKLRELAEEAEELSHRLRR